jgi:hypothetical protein
MAFYTRLGLMAVHGRGRRWVPTIPLLPNRKKVFRGGTFQGFEALVVVLFGSLLFLNW